MCLSYKDVIVTTQIYFSTQKIQNIGLLFFFFTKVANKFIAESFCSLHSIIDGGQRFMVQASDAVYGLKVAPLTTEGTATGSRSLG